MNKIFISIASYRDPELLPTIRDCIANADKPENLVFSIAWQHSNEDSWDNLDEFKDDPRFKIIDVDYKETLGTCWARHAIQQQYDNEDYYLQIDSHHRFVKGWDILCIKMIKSLQEIGHEKPLLTAYIPSYNPENDPAERAQDPWWMTFDRFIPEGAVFFLPVTIPNWENLKYPIPSRFLSAHFIFTLGSWVKEVPYDPEYYFHGEEISLAVRSYTWGYDLFHPHRVVCWHEYTRKGRTKQWDDDKEWYKKNVASHQKNRKLFEMDGIVRNEDFGIYDFGKVRSVEDYERYSGLCFKNRGVQQYTMDHNFAPNPPLYGEELEKSFLTIFRHCIDVYPHNLSENDYSFWVVAFENDKAETIYREDADEEELKRIYADNEFGYYKVWRKFETKERPVKWVVWPYSKSKGWVDRLEGSLTY